MMQQMQQHQNQQAQQQADVLRSLLAAVQPNAPPTPDRDAGPFTGEWTAANNRPDATQRGQRYGGRGRGRGEGVTCYRCRRPGHIARFCPESEPTGDAHAPTAAQPGNGTVPTANRRVLPARSAYLPICIGGHPCWCLLDSGSEVSIIPKKCLTSEEIRLNMHR